MAIQFGSTAVNAIKYCNASGVLQDVSCVLRNDAVVFPPKAAVFCLECVPANTTLLGTTGKVVSTSAPVTVNWGDGNTDTIAYSSDMRIPAHTYAAAGDYTIVISGATLTEVSAVSSVYYPILAETNKSGLTYLKRAVFAGITSIGSYCFRGCSGLTSLNIPSGVTSLGIQCFRGCSSLTSLVIPSGVTSLPRSCFYGCSGLTSLNIPSGVTSIGDYCFWDCSSLTSLVIPSGVTTLPQQCFVNCSSLTSLTIPSGVTSIGDYCFYDCSGLTSLVIPSGVTTLPKQCFVNCSSLTSLTIPSGVTSIGDYCLWGLTGLTTLTCKATTPPTLGTDVFHNVPKSIHVYVPSASIAAYQAASGWSDFTNFQPISE